MLLRRGADPNARSALGETALELAKRRGDAEMMRLLQPHTANRQTPSP